MKKVDSVYRDGRWYERVMGFGSEVKLVWECVDRG